MENNGTLLEVEDLRTWFSTDRGVLKAVDGISYSLSSGKTLGIVGESGSGKSVSVRSVMNILPAENLHTRSGQLRFSGKDISRPEQHLAKHLWGVEISMIFQDPMTSLNPVMKIGRQITETLKYHLSMNKARAAQKAEELLNLVEIPEPRRRLGEYPHQLSGGMRQRVTIAIAIACNPRLLIADEPTTALDVTVQKQIFDLLKNLQEKQNMGMILITHDLGVVAGRADDIAVMYAGKIVEMAPTDILFSEMRHPYTEALFNSIPKITERHHRRLMTIPGSPPDLTNLPKGCSFAPRCRYAQEKCLNESPDLPAAEAGNRHSFACFYPVGTQAGEQALDINLKRGKTATGQKLEKYINNRQEA